MTDYLKKAREIVEKFVWSDNGLAIPEGQVCHELAIMIATALEEEREQTFKDIEIILHEIQNLVVRETGMASIGLKTTIEAIEKLRTLKEKVK